MWDREKERDEKSVIRQIAVFILNLLHLIVVT